MCIVYEEFLDKIIKKLEDVSDKLEFLHPYSTYKTGKYIDGKNHPYAWTAGFWGGIVWYLYLYTKNEKYLKLAKDCVKHLEGALIGFDTLDHDIGFQFLLTAVADSFITKDEKSASMGLHASTILAGRYNLNGKYIRAWNENEVFNPEGSKAGYVIIDCLMNIPLLFWASERTHDPRFYQIACSHADTAIEHFIREDGSSNHIVVFDPYTGEVLEKPQGQGFAPGSSWTRGQGWALYGFAMCYHYTKDEKYLDVAKRVAKYIISNIKDYMPIDFKQPEEPRYEDTSAAAIIACGLLELMDYADDEEKEIYKSAVDKLMEILYNNCDFSEDDEAVLKNCSEMYHREQSRGVSLIYGDFYMLEALMRLTDKGAILFYDENKSEGME